MQAIRKISAVEQAEKSLIRYIASESVQIGDKLPTEKELCEKLDVGRGTIREATRLLQAKGYIEFRPGRGAFVSSKYEVDNTAIADWFRENENAIKDLIDVRMAIEPLAVELAIKRCSEAEIQQLVQLQKHSEEVLQTKEVHRLAQFDEEFHNLIAEFSGNLLIIEIFKLINSALATFRGKTFTIPTNVKNLIPAHAEIVSAFLERNAERGRTAILKHLDKVREDLEQSKDFYIR